MQIPAPRRGLLGLFSESIARAEREVHQAAGAVLHLLRRHVRGCNGRPAGGKWTRFLRLRHGEAPIR